MTVDVGSGAVRVGGGGGGGGGGGVRGRGRPRGATARGSAGARINRYIPSTTCAPSLLLPKEEILDKMKMLFKFRPAAARTIKCDQCKKEFPANVDESVLVHHIKTAHMVKAQEVGLDIKIYNYIDK